MTPTNAAAPTPCDIKDVALANQGRRRIEWAFQSMPVLQMIRKQFIKTQPLDGVRIAACVRVTSESANLIITLRDGGADVAVSAAGSLSTQDDVAACLVRDYSVPVYAIHGAEADVCAQHIGAVLDRRPQITIDEGAGLILTLHKSRQDQLQEIAGGTEQTTSGVAQVRALARQGALCYPVVAVTDALTKHLFDGLYGTGQSTVDGLLRTTNILLAGLKVVVAGYGWSGRGIAARARGLGANVIVTEVDPMKALEALMDGYRVMPMQEAAAVGEVFITVTGNRNVLARDHFERLKDGAILCSAGHTSAEIDVETLARLANSHREARESVEEYKMKDGRRICLLAEGRSMNAAGPEGQLPPVMDMSFANQALSVEYLCRNRESLEKKVYPVPQELDRQVARMKLDAMRVAIDKLTIEQEEYLAGWPEGM